MNIASEEKPVISDDVHMYEVVIHFVRCKIITSMITTKSIYLIVLGLSGN